MKSLKLYFSRSESPELVQVDFSANGQKTLCTVRGQTALDTGHHGTFNWSGAVRALAMLIVRAKTCSVDPHTLASRVLSGERGSPATSLDYAISKEPNWLLDMFGFDSKGGSLTKRLFRRINSGGKRPGPVSVALNESALPCKQISIFLDGQELTEAKDLLRLEASLSVPSGKSVQQSEEARGESFPARHSDTPDDVDAIVEDRPHWVIIGGGRIGRGFLNLIAEDLGFSTTLVVAGRNTPSHIADAYNRRRQQNKGYEVRANGPGKSECEVVRLSNYQFQLAFRSDRILERLSDPRTKVVSTSVGIERISEIAPLIAEGIRSRLEQNSESPLVVLVCENGRFPDGRSAREMLHALILECLSRHLHPYVTQWVTFPDVVLDCPIPSVPSNPSSQVQRGWGQMLLERSALVEELFSASRYVELVDDLSNSKLLKLYSFNSLHCYVSVIGSLLGYQFVHEVIRDPRLRPLVETLAGSVANAILAKLENDNEKRNLSETEIRSYCARTVERLAVSSPEYQDSVNRIVKRLLDGSYLHDGRLDGPLLALALDRNPRACPELIRMLSLTLFFIMKTREAYQSLFAPRMLYSEKLSALSDFQDLLRRGNAHAHIRRSVFKNAQDGENSAAFNVIADDLAYLEELMQGSETRALEVSQLLDYFKREVGAVGLRKLQSSERFDLRCVIFDLDEGLINSEALLYRVTREMIDEYSTASDRAFSHDDYARFVGMSEKEFFAREAIPRFQFSLTDPDELIKIREDRYLDLLVKTDRESLCKPGCRATLTLLRRCGVRLALYSNASRRRVDFTLNHIELRNYFDIVVSSSEHGMEDKPSPQMLCYVFEQLGVQPEECLVVESSSIGIEAAKAAGCNCVALENNYYPRRQATIRDSGIDFLGNGWQLYERMKMLIRQGANLGDSARVSGIERSERLKDIFEARLP